MNTLVQLLGSAAVAAVLAAVVTGLFSRRKLSAEAAEIITKAASGVVERLEAENARIAASNLVLGGRAEAQGILLEQVQRDLRALHEQVAVHVFWDQQAVEMAREQGLELPPPPPLTTGS